MPSVRVALKTVAKRLSGITETPQFEAELLLLHLLGWSRARLITHMDAPIDDALLEPLVQRRLTCEPIAYILGDWEFYSLTLSIEPPLLVPRPETEHLVEVALSHIPSVGGRVLDLCTGTGCVALALAHNANPDVIWACDVSDVAVRVASENARQHKLPIEVAQGDLFDALGPETAPFDVIVSNPPYVETGSWDSLAVDIRQFEDPVALLSGDDGLDCIRRIVDDAPKWLLSNGLLALEMGEGQGAAVRALLEARGFVDVAIVKDLAGHDRIAHGRWR